MGKSNLPIKEISNQDIGLAFIMNQKLPITPSWRFGTWKEGTEGIMKSVNKKREEMIKELGHTKEDGSVEVKPENKQKFLEQYKTLMEEKAEINIPDIAISLLSDIPLSVKFTTLIGKYLINDLPKYKMVPYPDLTNQKLLDMDLALSFIMHEQLPTLLAIKLGDAKRIGEKVSTELKDLRERLTKELGELNAKFDYEITDPASKQKFEEEIAEWLESTREEVVELPLFLIHEFEAPVTIDGEEQPLKFPLKFFTLFGPFIKEKEEKEEPKKKPAANQKKMQPAKA